MKAVKPPQRRGEPIDVISMRFRLLSCCEPAPMRRAAGTEEKIGQEIE
jgi:hypothetical protein